MNTIISQSIRAEEIFMVAEHRPIHSLADVFRSTCRSDDVAHEHCSSSCIHSSYSFVTLAMLLATLLRNIASLSQDRVA